MHRYLVDDIEKDEIQSGFLVTAGRKRIWNTELEILAIFDEICRRHDLRYYLDFGTLLGAVRHQGIIPWDDDIDVSMMRPDYERFKEIAANELHTPYFLQTAYTDNFTMAFAKIRDSRTSAVEFPYRQDMNQGIFIDIFPLDDARDGSERMEHILAMENELWGAVVDPAVIEQALSNGRQMDVNPKVLKQILAMPPMERMQTFESFCMRHFGESETVNLITSENLYHGANYRRDWYANVVRLPFEKLTLPAPAEYELRLRAQFGDYKQFIKGASCHGNIIFSADISYESYYGEGAQG